MLDHVARDSVCSREHLDHPATAEPLAQVRQVGGIAAERTVLVLDLDRDDRTAVRGLERDEPGISSSYQASTAARKPASLVRSAATRPESQNGMPPLDHSAQM